MPFYLRKISQQKIWGAQNDSLLESLCVRWSPLPWGRDEPFWGITGVQIFKIELKPVRRVNADANLNKFHHKEI